MFTLSTLIGLSIAAFVLGCVVGLVLSKTLSPQEQKARSLESKLQDSEKKLSAYQQEVTDHFAQTAKLVNSLTQSYRDVHEHLASDALKLANVDISRQLIKSSEGDGEDKLMGNTDFGEESYEPPKDWAPKTPGSEGTLSENFGLNDDDYKIHPEETKAS